jgi:hypothetical protein
MTTANTFQTARLLIGSSLCAVLLANAACTDGEMPPTSDRQDDGRQAGSPELRKTDAVGGDAEPCESEPSFIDALVHFDTPEEIDAWLELLSNLRSDFDSVCGDTFCEGEFSNYESLRFRCSVEESQGTIGSCVWVFGASNEDIAPSSGEVIVDGQVFVCPMPIAPGTVIGAFVEALSAPGVQPIRAPLPGSDQSLFDGLAGCL